jgi:hypothetical protein
MFGGLNVAPAVGYLRRETRVMPDVTLKN